MRQRARRLALFSGRRVLQGFGLAALVGVPLGILTGWNTLVRAVVDPSIQLLRPIPITRPSMPDRIEDLDEASPLARPMLCGPLTEKLRSGSASPALPQVYRPRLPTTFTLGLLARGSSMTEAIAPPMRSR